MVAEVIQDTYVLVRATGEIDLSNVAEFERALDEAATKAPNGFIIDLTYTTYIDSAGVQAILAVYAKMEDSAQRFALVVGNSRIKSVLEVVHLEKLPGIFVRESLDEARQAFPSAVRAG